MMKKGRQGTDRRKYERRVLDIPTIPDRRSGKERRTKKDRRT